VTYSWLVAVAISLTATVDLLVLRTFLLRRKAFWTAYAIMFGFQLLFNGILTGFRIVQYRPAAIVGWRIAYAPVEDLGFGFALILLTLSCWVALGRGQRTSARGRSGRGDGMMGA
jgi:lycopene cyclase domain-containing protein